MLIWEVPLRAQDRQALPDSVKIDSLIETAAAAPDDTAAGWQTDTGTRHLSDDSAREPARLRSIPDKQLENYRKDPDFAYANDPRYWADENEKAREPSAFERFLGRVLGSEGFKWFIYCLLGGVLLYAILKIIYSNRLYLFYKSSAKAQDLSGETGSVFDEDLDEKIRHAVAGKDFRGAVRFMFLKTLRLLDQGELIRFHIQSTNQEYVSQLSVHPLGKDFRRLVYVYEYIWYGEMPLSESQFGMLTPYFENFYKATGV